MINILRNILSWLLEDFVMRLKILENQRNIVKIENKSERNIHDGKYIIFSKYYFLEVSP